MSEGGLCVEDSFLQSSLSGLLQGGYLSCGNKNYSASPTISSHVYNFLPRASYSDIRNNKYKFGQEILPAKREGFCHPVDP
jgi:hypothetical protein